MALTPRLEIRQSQSLTLTPQLMQSIKLLQLSHLDLSQFVEQELLSNPLLESQELLENQEQAEQFAPNATENSQDKADGASAIDLVEAGQQLDSATGIAAEMDTDAANLYPEQVGQDSVSASSVHSSSNSLGTIRQSPGAEAPDIDQYVAAKISLSDHLAEQISYLVTKPIDRLIARNLIDNLDDAGYLVTDCTTIAKQLGASVDLVEQVLENLQGVEPIGVFARNLKECLALQLKDRNRLDPMMHALLENLDLVASHALETLAKTIEATQEDISGMLREIRELDPRPGRAFDGTPMQAIVPDVFVKEGPNSGWLIELNTAVLPKVLVNRTYYATVSKNKLQPNEKAFLVDCLQSANWLTKSLDQRAQTILKVAKEIVRMQDEFLLHGVTHLKPMTLKNVADAIEMHESTVSRVTSNKYMATPRGLFELKYFFTTALASSNGSQEHSAESVRHLIKQLIESETLKSILSDETIAEILNKTHSIDVARRTVAKYREGLNIPSSVIRRRQKKSRADGAVNGYKPV